MLLLKILSRLPFVILYAIADGLFILIYYIVPYRKKVVFDNLKKAFPDKNEQEIKKIARGFYKNLLEVVVETLKLLSISKDALRKRVKIENREVIEAFYQQKRSVIVLTGHQCNWEWLLASCSYQLNFAVDAVYLRLTNAFSERLLQKIRGRFGARLIEKKFLLRALIATKDLVKIVAMVADQAPHRGTSGYWTNFLNQETNFFIGAEKLAKKMNFPVLYVEMKRQKRGYYRITFDVLSDSPKTSKDNEITARFVSAMEKTIQENASDWLWSHKRWKYAHKRNLKSGPEKLV